MLVGDDEGPALLWGGQAERSNNGAAFLCTVSSKKLHHFHVLTLFHTIWWVLSRAFTILSLVSIPEIEVMVTLFYVPL